MSLAQVRAQSHRGLRGVLCQIEVLVIVGHVKEVDLRFRESAIGQSKVRIALHRLFEQFDFLVQTFFRALPIAPEVDLLGLCIVSIGH